MLKVFKIMLNGDSSWLEVLLASATFAVIGFVLGGSFSWFAIIEPKSAWIYLGIMSGVIMAGIGIVMQLSERYKKPYLMKLILPICLASMAITIVVL
jgi:hypothetical protein